MVTLIITILLKEYRKDFACFAVLIGGAIILSMLLETLTGIVDFIKTLNYVSGMQFISILLKMTGICILTEYAVSICKDSGETSIANKIDFGGKVLVISMSIPVIATTLESLVKLLP